MKESGRLTYDEVQEMSYNTFAQAVTFRWVKGEMKIRTIDLGFLNITQKDLAQLATKNRKIPRELDDIDEQDDVSGECEGDFVAQEETEDEANGTSSNEKDARKCSKRDPTKGHWIFGWRKEPVHVIWSGPSCGSPHLFGRDNPLKNIKWDELTMENAPKWQDLSAEDRLLFQKAYHLLVCHIPWRGSPEHQFLRHDKTIIDKLRHCDPNEGSHRSAIRMKAFYDVLMQQEDIHPQYFDYMIDSALLRDMQFSATLYQSVAHNRSVNRAGRKDKQFFVHVRTVNEEGDDEVGDEGVNDDSVDETIDNFEVPLLDDGDLAVQILQHKPPSLESIHVLMDGSPMHNVITNLWPKSTSHPFLASPPEPQTQLCQLTEAQRYAYDMATSEVIAIRTPKVKHRLTPQTLYIKGLAGAGKTEVALHICQFYRGRIQVGAPTSVAASLFNGPTMHKFFNWPAGPRLTNWSLESHGDFDMLRELYKDIDVFLIDEINAAAPELLYKLHQTLKDLFGDSAFFGGKRMIFLGDPAQLDPVLTQPLYTKASKIEKPKRLTDYKVEAYRQKTLGLNLYRDLLRRNVILLKQSQRNKGALQIIASKLRQGQQTVEDLRALCLQRQKFPDAHPDIGFHYTNESKHRSNLEALLEYIKQNEEQSVFNCFASYHESLPNFDNSILDEADALVGEKKKKLKALRDMSAKYFHDAQDLLQLATNVDVALLYNVDLEANLIKGLKGKVVSALYNPRDAKLRAIGDHPTPLAVVVDFPGFRGFTRNAQAERIRKVKKRQTDDSGCEPADGTRFSNQISTTYGMSETDADGKTRYYQFRAHKTWVAVLPHRFDLSWSGEQRIEKYLGSKAACWRKQFPLALCSHRTIHKAQSATYIGCRISVNILDNDLGLSSTTENLAPLIYVAITRAQNLNQG